jgi:hypothetical protein
MFKKQTLLRISEELSPILRIVSYRIDSIIVDGWRSLRRTLSLWTRPAGLRFLTFWTWRRVKARTDEDQARYAGCQLGSSTLYLELGAAHDNGTDRLEELRLFVRAAALERQGKVILDRSRSKLVVTVTQQRLTPNQRAAVLDRYKDYVARLPMGR